MDNRYEATLRILWQAETHAIFFLERVRKSNILPYMYRRKSSRSSEKKSSLNYKTTEPQALNQFPDLSKLTDPEPLEWRVDHVPLKEAPMSLTKIIVLIFLLALSNETYGLLPG